MPVTIAEAEDARNAAMKARAAADDAYEMARTTSARAATVVSAKARVELREAATRATEAARAAETAATHAATAETAARADPNPAAKEAAVTAARAAETAANLARTAADAAATAANPGFFKWLFTDETGGRVMLRGISLILFLALLAIIVRLFLTGGLDLSKVDSTQGLIAGVLLVTISLLVVVMIMTTLFGGTNETLDVRIRLARDVLSPVLAIFGTVTGFYFGSQIGEKAGRGDPPSAAIVKLGGSFTGGVVDLQKTKIKDADLSVLKDLPGVVSVNLSGTDITDLGLKTLHEIKTLKVVDLTGTKTTAAGIAELEKAVKDLKVIQGSAPIPPLKPQ